MSRRKLSQLKGSERAKLVSALTRYPLNVNGSEGYKKAEVTGGGVPLEELNCSTMESKVRAVSYPADKTLHDMHLLPHCSPCRACISAARYWTCLGVSVASIFIGLGSAAVWLAWARPCMATRPACASPSRPKRRSGGRGTRIGEYIMNGDFL